MSVNVAVAVLALVGAVEPCHSAGHDVQHADVDVNRVPVRQCTSMCHSPLRRILRSMPYSTQYYTPYPYLHLGRVQREQLRREKELGGGT